MGQGNDPQTEWQTLIAQVIEQRAERNFEQAFRLCRDAVGFARKKFGKFHPECIAAHVLCGELACRAGNHGSALNEYVHARKLLSQAHHEQHPLYAELYKGFAYVYMKQQLFGEAAAFYQKAVEIVEAQPDPGSHSAAELRLYLGDALRQAGRIDAAQAAYGHALAVFKELGDEGAEQAVQALARLGYLQHDMGHFEQARTLLEESLFALQEGHDKKLRLTLLEMLWSACENLGDQAEAASYRLQLLEDEKDAAADGRARIALLRELAGTYSDCGDAAGAERTHIEIINAVCDEFGEESGELAEAKQALGELYCLNGDLKQAKVTLNSTLNHYIGTGSKHPSTAAVYHNLGTVFLADGELNDAAMFLKKALRMREQAEESELPEIARTLIALGNTLLQKNE